MKTTKLNQKGIGVVEGLLILIIVLLVGFIGYYVMNSQKEADNTLTEATKTSTTNTTTPADAQPVYKSAEVELYDLSQIAETSSQKAVVVAISQKCLNDAKANDATTKSSDVIVVGLKDTFTKGGGSYVESQDFARLTAGCGVKPISAQDGTAMFVMQKKSGKWTVLSAGQQGPSCSQVDGIKIPTTIVDECYDEATSQNRAPK